MVNNKKQIASDSAVAHLGLPMSLLQAFFKSSSTGKVVQRFILPISLVDLSKRDEEYKAATRAKIAAELQLIDYYYPGVPVEILLGDTLRLENSSAQTQEQASDEINHLIKQWAEFLDLPLMDLGPMNTSIECTYNTPTPRKIKLSSWQHYQQTAITELMQKVHVAFSKLYAETSQSPEKQTNILMDDSLLLGQNHLGFIRQSLEHKLKESLGYTAFDSPMFQDLLHGFSMAAAHHLKKIHKITLEETHHPRSMASPKDPNITKKTNIYNELPEESRFKEFENAFCYILQEFLVIIDILVTHPKKTHTPQHQIIWMLYTAGITDVPKNHPVIQLNTFLSSANLARRFFPCSEFKIQNNDIATCSNGEDTMLNARSPAQQIQQPQLISALPPQQQDNNSLAATPSTSESKTRSQSGDYSSGEDMPNDESTSRTSSENGKNLSSDEEQFQTDETLEQKQKAIEETKREILNKYLTELVMQNVDKPEGRMTVEAALQMMVLSKTITPATGVTATAASFLPSRQKPKNTQAPAQTQTVIPTQQTSNMIN